jgi:hypothetical protein
LLRVEGLALAGVDPLPWLTLWAGPHARTYCGAAGDERWLTWELRAAVRAGVVADRVALIAEIASVVAARIDGPEPFARGVGTEGGISARLPGTGVWGLLTYRVRQDRLAGGRRVTDEAVTLRARFTFGRSWR